MAFVGQQEYFSCHYGRELLPHCDFRAFQLHYDVDASYYDEIIDFDPEITLVFRGELMPPSVIAQLSGTKIAYSTEPFPKILHGRVHYTLDSLSRFESFLESFAREYDYIFHYDQASETFLCAQGVMLSGYGPLPIAAETFRPYGGEKTRDILFVGRSTGHRESILEHLKRDFDVLHIAHGWPGPGDLEEALRRIGTFKVVLNIHAEDEISWEPRIQQFLACGSLIVSEPISPNTVLQPGRHFLEARNPAEFYSLCSDIIQARTDMRV